jgi:hypothetical protein
MTEAARWRVAVGGEETTALALTLLVWAFVASRYGYAVALPLGAHYGYRGVTAKPPFLNRAVYLGNMIGVVRSLIGSVILLWGVYAAV